MVGEPGCGKSVYSKQVFEHFSADEQYMTAYVEFRAQTPANVIQLTVGSMLEKRHKNTFGPPRGKKLVVLLDDMNAPNPDKHSAQPPLEAVRQLVELDGWYSSEPKTAFTQVEDTMIVGCISASRRCCNTTHRVLRHFVPIALPLTMLSLQSIYQSILSNFIESLPFAGEVRKALPTLVQSTIDIYDAVIHHQLPTPSKPHRQFHPRNLRQVFNGLMLATPQTCTNKADLLKLWVHEVT